MNNNTENNQQPTITATPVVPSAPTVPSGATTAAAPATPVVPSTAAPTTEPVKVDTNLANQHLQLVDDKPKLNIVTQDQIDAKEQAAAAAAAEKPAKPEKAGGGCLSNLFLFILLALQKC